MSWFKKTRQSASSQTTDTHQDTDAHTAAPSVDIDGQEDAQHSTDETSVIKKNKKRHWGWWALLLVILLPVSLICGVVGLAQTESGTRALFSVIKTVSFNHINGQWITGSLAHGGAASEINVNLTNTKVRLENLSGQWSWDYVPLKWHVDSISADVVDVTVIPSGDNTPTQKVLMPFPFVGNRVQVNTLNIHTGTTTTVMTAIDGSVKTDTRNHEINLTNLTQGSAQFSGQATIDGMRPFKMDVDLAAVSQYESNDYHLNVKATGDLNKWDIKLNASGGSQTQPLQGSGDLSLQLLNYFYIRNGQVSFKNLNPYAFWDKLLKADLDIDLNTSPASDVAASDSNLPPVNGTIKAVNHAPGPLSDISVPVTQVDAAFNLTEQTQVVHDIVLSLSNGGKITGAGQMQKTEGQFAFDVAGFDLKMVHPKLISSKLNGPLTIKTSSVGQDIVSTLTQNGLKLFADVNVNSQRVEIKKAQVTSSMGNTPEAAIEGTGKLEYLDGLPFEFNTKLLKFDLSSLGDFPSSKLQGEFNVKGHSTPQAFVSVKGQLVDSTWGGVPASGKVDLDFAAPDTLIARELDFKVGANRAYAKGSMGVSGDNGKGLTFDIQAPNLAQLQFGMGGSLLAKGVLTGSLTKPRGTVDASASQLVIGEQRISSASLKGKLESGTNGAVDADVSINGYQNGQINMSAVDLKVNGTQQTHQFSGKAKGSIHIKGDTTTDAVDFVLDGDFNGTGKVTNKGWQGQVNSLVNKGEPSITLQRPMGVAYESSEFKLNNVQARVEAAQLNMETFYMKGLSITSKGRVDNMVVPQWLNWLRLKLPFYTNDLTVKGNWDMSMGDSPRGGFGFEREGGDISLDRRQRNMIGLQRMIVNGQFSGRSLLINAGLTSSRIGQADIKGTVGMVGSSNGWVLSPLSPLNLQGKAQFSELKQFNSLMGVNIRLDGQMQADMTIKGVIAQPIIEGLLTGQDIDFLHVEQGFRLKEGVVRLKLFESRVEFEQFDFKGVEGTLSVRGQVSFGGENRGLSARVTMDKLKPFVRLDRQVVLSGVADLGYDPIKNKMIVTGKVRADSALIDMPPTLAPSLSDDVVICRVGNTSPRCPNNQLAQEPIAEAQVVKKPTKTIAPEANTGQDGDIKIVRSTDAPANSEMQAASKPAKTSAARKPKKATVSRTVVNEPKPKGQPFVTKEEALGILPEIDLVLDLGRDFRFKGQGADVKLRGNLHLVTAPRAENDRTTVLRATGLVRVEEGTYLFYGQRLNVERGQITFQGDISDPALNLRAVRTAGTIEVGVEVEGTLANPVARLVSTPEMPDEEKLSWLLFSRSSSSLGTGDSGAIAGAAAILLGSEQGRKITQKLGIDDFNFGASDNGLTGNVVGFGKRLNNKLAVSYEQSLEDVKGVVKITWTLSRNWQAVLRAGSINGADIQYNKRFDKLGKQPIYLGAPTNKDSQGGKDNNSSNP